MKGLEKLEFFVELDGLYLPTEYTDRIYHYTSTAGFYSILFGTSKNISLWASRIDCLNDMSEGKVAEKVLQEVAYDLLMQGEIDKEIYQLFSTVKTSKEILLYRNNSGELKFRNAKCNRYICSFTKNCDSLNMWNYYAKEGKQIGFNVGFFPSDIKEALGEWLSGLESRFHIYPVVYDSCEQKNMIKDLLLQLKPYCSKENEPRIRAIISDRLVDWGVIFKNSTFHNEEEVRIVVDIPQAEAGVLTHYRISDNNFIPYIEMKIKKEALSSVCFGPTRTKDEQFEIVEEMLHNNNYQDVEMIKSDIPIRG